MAIMPHCHQDSGWPARMQKKIAVGVMRFTRELPDERAA
jgi:hypothetical protein